MHLGTTITDHKSQICRIVSSGDNDVTVDCFTVFPNELSHDILHFQKDSLDIFEDIEETAYHRVEEIYNSTKSQLKSLVKNAERLPLEYSSGKGLYKVATIDPYSSLMLINKEKSETMEVEMVSFIEDAFMIHSAEIGREHVDGAVEYGIDSKVIEKALKMVSMAIAAVQAII